MTNTRTWHPKLPNGTSRPQILFASVLVVLCSHYYPFLIDLNTTHDIRSISLRLSDRVYSTPRMRLRARCSRYPDMSNKWDEGVKASHKIHTHRNR